MNVQILGEDDVAYGGDWSSSLKQIMARMPKSPIPSVAAYPLAASPIPAVASRTSPLFYNPVMARAQMVSRGFLPGMRPSATTPGLNFAQRTTQLSQTQKQRLVAALRQKTQLLGDDVYGDGFDWSALGTALADTAIKVTGAVVQSRLTPTQKAQISNIQEAAGLSPYPIQSTSPVPQFPQQETGLQKNIPYIIIGGAVIVGALFMLGTRRSRRR